MKIRESTQNDKNCIRKIHLEAFGALEGETVAQLAIELVDEKTALPALSMVAEEDGQLIGRLLFTTITVGSTGFEGGYILAPLSVESGFQSKGVGATLIKTGLGKLQERGVSIVLVLGDPAYYSRTGFKAGHHLIPPYELECPKAWMAQELRVGAFEAVKGPVR